MSGGWPFLLLLGGTVLLGAVVQRLAGIGFGLLAGPALVLLMGPVQGVALVNCAGVAIGIRCCWPCSGRSSPSRCCC